MATRETTKTDSRLAGCAAVASLGGSDSFRCRADARAGLVAVGVFLCGQLATFQLIWAYFAWSRPGTWVLAAGIAANATAATLWVMSCLTGPPVGPRRPAGSRRWVRGHLCVAVADLRDHGRSVVLVAEG